MHLVNNIKNTYIKKLDCGTSSPRGRDVRNSPQTLVLTQKKFGPHKVDPTRFARFFLREQEVA